MALRRQLEDRLAGAAGLHASVALSPRPSQRKVTAEKSPLDLKLKDHKADREQAKTDVDSATAIRVKEKTEYETTAAESAANIKALSSALPALEKGTGSSALLQLLTRELATTE